MSDTTNAARPGRFRKKPVVIDAIRWSGYQSDLPAIFAFIGDFSKLPGVGYVSALGELEIPTLEGRMTARPGDWIIKGVKGEFYPCKPDIFEATYERAESRSAEPTSEVERAREWCARNSDLFSQLTGEELVEAYAAALAHPEAPKNEAADKARYAAWLKFIGGFRVSVPNFSWDNEILADAVRNAYEESLDVLATHPGARTAHAVCENSRDCIACGERIEPAFGVCYSCAVADPKIHAERTRAAQTQSEDVR